MVASGAGFLSGCCKVPTLMSMLPRKQCTMMHVAAALAPHAPLFARACSTRALSGCQLPPCPPPEPHTESARRQPTHISPRRAYAPQSTLQQQTSYPQHAPPDSRLGQSTRTVEQTWFSVVDDLLGDTKATTIALSPTHLVAKGVFYRLSRHAAPPTAQKRRRKGALTLGDGGFRIVKSIYATCTGL